MNNKVTIILLVSVLLAVKTNSQITKGNWIVGGNIQFSSTNYQSDAGSKSVGTDLKIAPHLGYFVANKVAAGLSTNISRQSYKVSTSVSSTFTDFSAGPFIRYYLMPAAQQLNIVTEAGYLFGFTGGNGSGSHPYKSTFAFAAGPVVYFNTSVGLEFLIGYSTYKYARFSGRDNAFQLGLGLQAHLEKDK